MRQVRTAIVTGGTAGIGLATAEALLRGGHRAFICGRDKNRLVAALDRLKPIGHERIFGGICDVRDIAACLNMANEALSAFDRIDALVNSAGIGFIEPFDNLTSAKWNDIIATNLTGVFNCCKATIPLIRRAGGGDIINLGSRSGRYSFRGGTGYNATKFGLQGFTEALFLDLHNDNIRVSLVAPGTVATNLVEAPPQSWHLMPEDVGKVIVGMIESSARACVNWVEIRPSHPQ